ncbi:MULTISPECIES: exopolysaccharide biosynthesis protein [unclassified Ectothiorhodospira]|uniref:exopolysaccharide biosynthesis protein n=1 Tax=unclassified Ectothiorhodospira TaxID=2684909 RepID=UPI001EE962F9|nr:MULTISPECIES: exopolysaccharide biosynthesis protein [unclassified Ectothiorhodospira]MCG5516886.1 exopolysaccharide biosynthesis protein [Ectothiorhodospira sp. 9100]MCG5519848.1 exopolysaccharide biosynthesis protein [Ectothiorhodospira sp. 9905]
MGNTINSLQELLEKIGEIEAHDGIVSLQSVLQKIGRRSFGPLLLVAGLVTVAPLIGDIPGVPTLMGLLVLLTAGQLLLGRQRFWLPRFILERSVPDSTLRKVLDRLQRPARFLDRLFRPRLMLLSTGPGVYLIAVACLLIAVIMPFLEAIPFSANGAAAALIAFGLSLIARDGILALFALLVTGMIFSLVIYQFAFT